MEDEELLARVFYDPSKTAVMEGRPVIKGTRLTVAYVLNLMAHDATMAEITQEYEPLTEEDIKACFLFASEALERQFIDDRANYARGGGRIDEASGR